MDRLILGLSTTAVGMLVVFSGLVILIACIYGMTSITGRKKALPPRPVPALPDIPPVPSAQEAPQEDDLAVIAAITAAVTVLWQEEGNQGGFVVRRVRRVQSSTARARAARDEQIFNHF